jgi:hypothetical protein
MTYLMRYPGAVDITCIIEHALFLRDPQVDTNVFKKLEFIYPYFQETRDFLTNFNLSSLVLLHAYNCVIEYVTTLNAAVNKYMCIWFTIPQYVSASQKLKIKI